VDRISIIYRHTLKDVEYTVKYAQRVDGHRFIKKIDIN
jgi:hypothetical protein